MDTQDAQPGDRGHYPGRTDRRGLSDAAPTVTLANMVCQECNNTWMSRLENRRVKPFLAPMLTNEHAVTLDETRQRDLARWAVIKVLLMEHAMRQRRAHLRSTVGYAPSDPELAWLYHNDDPPPRSRVWLGAYATAVAGG